MKRLALFALLVCGVADANVWQRALEPKPDLAREEYENKLSRGDELAKQANMSGRSSRDIRGAVNAAAQAYRDAAKAKPELGEPYFRLGMLLFSFYFQQCTTSAGGVNAMSPLCGDKFDSVVATQIIDAWQAFEVRAPLDPRLHAPPRVDADGTDLLFERAILHTKLATRPHLEAAARDYEALLKGSDTSNATLELVWSNLAETYMMLGDLDRSIEAYRFALRGGGSLGTGYGLAVALDRDENPAASMQQIRDLGPRAREEFVLAFQAKRVFFVPVGEEQYYFALIAEANGEYDEALAHWRMYIASGAHPQYQPRAKEHVDAIIRTLKQRPIQPPPLDPIFFP